MTSAAGRKRQGRSSKPPSAIWWVRSQPELHGTLTEKVQGGKGERGKKEWREGGRGEGRERKVLEGQFNYHKSFNG